MLSRIAESFFWLGRYVERAEATARMLSEHHQLLVEDRSVPEEMGCALLLDALTMPSLGVETAQDLVRVVVGSELESSTIAGAVASARTNARAVRDSLSQDTFEALNSAHLALSRGMAFTASPGVALHRVLERLLVVNGVVDWTMPRDEAYQFMVLGRELERIDMVGRLLSIRHDEMWPSSGPAAALRAAGALSPYLRTGKPLNADRRPPVPRARRDVPPVDALLRGGRGGGRPRPAATGGQRQRLAAARGRHAALGAGVRPRALVQ